MRGALATTLIICFALAGCGGSKSGSPQTGSSAGSTSSQTGSSQPVVAAGWTRHHVAKSGFSLDTPEKWKTLSAIDAGTLGNFFRENPQFEPFKSAIASGVIKIFAFDPKISQGFATNLNVVVHGLGRDVSLSDYADASSAEIARLTGAKPEVKLTDLPAGQTARFSYNTSEQLNGKKTELSILQYAFLHNQSEYVLTFTTRPPLQDRYRETFEHVASTFSFDD
jgi:hypothetical protein